MDSGVARYHFLPFATAEHLSARVWEAVCALMLRVALATEGRSSRHGANGRERVPSDGVLERTFGSGLC